MTGERCLKHRGEYFERYATNEKFEHHFKLHLSHRIALKIGREICSLEFSLCIINIGNMLNQGWAVRMHRPARTTRSVITAAHRISWFLHAPPRLRHAFLRRLLFALAGSIQGGTGVLTGIHAHPVQTEKAGTHKSVPLCPTKANNPVYR